MNKTANFNLRVYLPKQLKMNKTPGEKFRVAFTMIEVMVVLAIIGILFVTFIPRLDYAGDKARETGVKSDFRSFALAAEQVLRENAGVSKHNDLATLCEDNGGINQYLDAAMQFDTSGDSELLDPWNNKYTVQVFQQSGTPNLNNGCVIFLSGGKDGDLDTTDSNYAIAVTFIDGVIGTATKGFSSNIASDSITDIDGDSDASMSAPPGAVTIKYAK